MNSIAYEDEHGHTMVVAVPDTYDGMDFRRTYFASLANVLNRAAQRESKKAIQLRMEGNRLRAESNTREAQAVMKYKHSLELRNMAIKMEMEISNVQDKKAKKLRRPRGLGI